VGPEGPAFAQTFLQTNRYANQTLLTEEAVVFDAPDFITYGECGHNVGESEVYIWGAGYYKILFTLYHIEPCQFSIFINGAPETGTITGSATGASVCTLAHIIYLSPADVAVSPTALSPTGFAAKIQLVNHTSFAPAITLDSSTGSGSATPQTRAALSMFKLANAPV
jgi:hypothetical protein